jgi:hypothetical protein
MRSRTGPTRKNGRPVQADCEAIEAGRRALVGASRVQVTAYGPTSTSRARCWSKKESVRIPSLRRFDISREQDGEMLGFIPVYANRFMEDIRTAISKA